MLATKTIRSLVFLGSLLAVSASSQVRIGAGDTPSFLATTDPTTWSTANADLDIPQQPWDQGVLEEKRVLTVEPGTRIRHVLDSITDASAANPYGIILPPGIYDFTDDDIVLKEHLHIRGFGPGATIVELGNSHSIIAASNSSISDMTIEYTGVGIGAITDDYNIRNFALNRVEFNIENDNAAIFFTSEGYSKVWLYDVKILTEGIGISVNGWGCFYLHDVDIFLTGDSLGSPHIGIQVNSGSRFYLWGSKIGTGYGYPEIENGGDQDVLGIYIPSSNINNPRVEIHGLESFIRNAEAVSNVKVNVIRAEAGWVRCFGCFGQAETPLVRGLGRSLHQSGKGKIEVYGSRFSSYAGNVFGSPQRGVSRYNTSHDGHGLEKFEGGLILLDATDGPFTLYLRILWGKGEEYIFKKIDNTNNVVTISGSGRLIDGMPSVDLRFQYETLRIIGSNGGWHEF